jgi:hypothetical protein
LVSKPPDTLFEFFPGHRDHWVSTVTVPEFVARPTPVPHQVEMVEFFAEKAVRLGRMMNIEWSFL